MPFGRASTSWPGSRRGCKSLEELEAARAGYSDAARAVLAQANGKVNQQGAVADYLEVEQGYERAVEAALGDSAPARHRRARRSTPRRVSSWCARPARAAAAS